MVVGMLFNFLGSFIIVLFMMLFLFRSPIKALISMIPLSITILFIYSLLGFFGKDYDMPVAVLSALTLGLSIDFAIHFIQRAIEVYEEKPSWKETANDMFGGPGRAIMRNAFVVAIGFLPLLLAPLIPYRTVGFFMFMIMAVSSAATLLILPALASLKPHWFFHGKERGMVCNCRNCFLIGIFVAAAVAYVMGGYSTAGWSIITLVSIGIIAFAGMLCNFVSKHKFCIKK
jgi:predicted RND superfamily exporter protein